jgi:hypothetical protein
VEVPALKECERVGLEAFNCRAATFGFRTRPGACSNARSVCRRSSSASVIINGSANPWRKNVAGGDVDAALGSGAIGLSHVTVFSASRLRIAPGGAQA